MVVVFVLDELAEEDLPLDSNLAVDPDGEPIADLALAMAEEEEDMAPCCSQRGGTGEEEGVENNMNW